jgi:hypothetical protein
MDSRMELVETAGRDENCLFRKFRPFVVFAITLNNVHCIRTQGKIAECTWEENGENVEIIVTYQ